MRRGRAGLLMFALCSCAQAADCATSADASVDDAMYEAGTALPDAGESDGCNPLAPLTLSIESVYTAVGPTSSVTCGAFGRIRLFGHQTGAVVFDSDTLPRAPVCSPGAFDMNLQAGDYDLTIEGVDQPQWLVGGSLVRPERCGPDGPGGPFCSPIRVVIPPCESRSIMAVLYCDPLAGSCPDADWPWLHPPP